LVQGKNGSLYGIAFYTYAPQFGSIIFDFSPSGKFSYVHLIGADWSYLNAGLIEGVDGAIYGTASKGGAYNEGVVFKFLQGNFTVLHDFTGGADGGFPRVGLVQATDGNLYGTTGGLGTIFRVSPTGEFATLYTFPDDGSMGLNPFTVLVQHTNGRLYGTTAAGGTNNDGVFFSLDVGLLPFVTFLPAARQVGHTVEILGQGFTGTSAVSFNGTPAAFIVYSDTYLTATVPDGATTGSIRVTTPGGTLTSNKQFQVKPQITSISPTSGPVGTPVVITGVSLAQTSKITFGSVVATNVVVNSDTQVTVNVPAGAATTKIGLVTTGAPVYSEVTFTVTQ
jgi:uncharacterized repeat protein (TIGR03803 family)